MNWNSVYIVPVIDMTLVFMLYIALLFSWTRIQKKFHCCSLVFKMYEYLKSVLQISLLTLTFICDLGCFCCFSYKQVWERWVLCIFSFSSVSGCQFKRTILAFTFFFPKLLEKIFEFKIDEYKWKWHWNRRLMHPWRLPDLCLRQYCNKI